MSVDINLDRGGGPEQLGRVFRLPDPLLNENWERIFAPAAKRRLPRYLGVLAETALAGASIVGLALRRAILLYGPPGCGKTSLAYGLPNAWASSQTIDAVLVIANTHSVRSAELGKTEKRVAELFGRIDEIASTGVLTFVVIDEVETIASDRASINPETNPLDTLYSVNAVLEHLDETVRRRPNVIFILTTNIPRMIDRAVSERVDFAMEIALPDSAQRDRILADSLIEVDRLLRRPVSPWAASPGWPELLAATSSLSGRELRHLPLVALTMIDASSDLEARHLVEAAQEQAAQRLRNIATAGVYTHEYQRSTSGLSFEGGRCAMRIDGLPIDTVASDTPERRLSARHDQPEAADNSKEWDGSGEEMPTDTDSADDGAEEFPAVPEADDLIIARPPNGEAPVTDSVPPGERQPMRAARRVAALPKRSPERAWAIATQLFKDIVETRGGARASEVASALDRIRPLGSNLLTVHALRDGRVEFGTGDLLVDVAFVDGVTAVDENIALPPLAALNPAPDNQTATLTFFVARDTNPSLYGRLLDDVSDLAALEVRIVTTAEDADHERH